MVYARGNVEQESAAGRNPGDGSAGRTAGASVSCARNRRGIFNAADSGAGGARGVRARLAGFKSSRAVSFAPGKIFE